MSYAGVDHLTLVYAPALPREAESRQRMREYAQLGAEEGNRAVSDLIDLAAAVDGILQMQTAAHADYSLKV